MDSDSLSKKAPPVQQTSPEEDATLLAIEALEAQSVDLDRPKVEAPAPAPTPAVVVPPAPKQAPIRTVVPERIVAPTPVAPVPEPAKIPVAAPKPVPTPVAPVAPKPIAPVRPKAPATPAEEIAEALASDEPAPKRFQFFLNQKPPRKPFVIGGLILVLIALGVGAYVTLL